jgi:hypothetical protein
MFSSDKRASLTSGLLAAKEQTLSKEGGAEGGTPSASLFALPRAGARQRVLVAVRRPEGAEDTDASGASAEEPEAKAELGVQDSVLYSKGDASASGFRPWYWSYDRDGAPPAESAAAAVPLAAAMPVAPRRRRAAMALGLLAAFSTVALLGSATLFVLSRHVAPDAAKSSVVIAQPLPMAVPVPAPPHPTPVTPLPKLAAKATGRSPAPATSAEITELMVRGNQMLATGDIAAARLFYERAAQDGSAAAARQAGKTYDPLFLLEVRARGFRGDPVAAARWYRKASAGGDQEADVLMKRLIARYAG